MVSLYIALFSASSFAIRACSAFTRSVSWWLSFCKSWFCSSTLDSSEPRCRFSLSSFRFNFSNPEIREACSLTVASRLSRFFALSSSTTREMGSEAFSSNATLIA